MRTVFDERERRGWAGLAPAYAAGLGKLCAYPAPHLLDGAGVTAGTRLLDVGTGPGTVAALAADRGATVAALDVQPDMVALAAAAVPTAGLCVAALPRLPFTDGQFDVVTANFVLNHVGSPSTALSELRRVTRAGGRIGVTFWSMPPGAGAAVLGLAVQAAGVRRPADLPELPAEEDFERDEQGLAGLLAAAGLTGIECRTIEWNHRVGVEEWWNGFAVGLAYVGQLLARSAPQVVAEIRGHFDRLSAPFLEQNGELVLPHKALLAISTAL